MNKLYYSISEVSELVDEEQHILRYWEKEFPQLNPKKNRGGNRVYSTKDIAIISAIKKLLREDKLSLKGAKEQIEKLAENPDLEELFPGNSLQPSHAPQHVDNTGKKGFRLTHEEYEEMRAIILEIREMLLDA